jgi:hypothetical protein
MLLASSHAETRPLVPATAATLEREFSNSPCLFRADRCTWSLPLSTAPAVNAVPVHADRDEQTNDRESHRHKSDDCRQPRHPQCLFGNDQSVSCHAIGPKAVLILFFGGLAITFLAISILIAANKPWWQARCAAAYLAGVICCWAIIYMAAK